MGSKTGIGKIYFITVKGLLAWIIWMFLSILFTLDTNKNKSHDMLVIGIFVPRNAVMTDSINKPSFEFQNYKKNDVVFTEGMAIADGFYIVQSGEFINTYKKTINGRSFTKIYKKGDHFGSRVILEGGRRTGTISKKNSEVLRIDKESFKLMASNLPALKRYFSEYLPKNFKN